jgi:hypothetical protein
MYILTSYILMVWGVTKINFFECDGCDML